MSRLTKSSRRRQGSAITIVQTALALTQLWSAQFAGAQTDCSSEYAALSEAGSSIATLVCSEEAMPTDQTSMLTDAIAGAQRTDCLDDGAVAAITDSFVETQTCSCASAGRIIGVQIGGVADGSADVDAETTVADLIAFSEEYCTPGSVDGVLDQDAGECIAISQGNATESATAAGLLVRDYACGNATVSAASVSSALAGAVSDALAAGEKACSPKPSVRCALEPEYVRNAAAAQVAEMVRAFDDSAMDPGVPCTCASRLDVDAIGSALNISAPGAHEAACLSGQSDMEDTRPVMMAAMMGAVSGALAELSNATSTANVNLPPGEACVGSSAPTEAPNMAAAAFEPCGSDPSDQGMGGCCVPGFQCVVKNRFYSQCRPEERPIPADWSGEIVACDL